MSEIVENLPELKKVPTEDPVEAQPEPAADETTKNVTKEEEYDKRFALFVERKLPALLLKHKEVSRTTTRPVS